jgi:hypothetical protein
MIKKRMMIKIISEIIKKMKIKTIKKRRIKTTIRKKIIKTIKTKRTNLNPIKYLLSN